MNNQNQNEFKIIKFILEISGKTINDLCNHFNHSLTKNPLEKRLLNQAESSYYLGVSVNTFKSLKIQPLFLKGIKRFDIYDLDDYIIKLKTEKIE